MARFQSITNDRFLQTKITTSDLSFYYGFSDVPPIQSLSDFITELTQEGSAYWDKNHINHQKAVDEVLKLREMLNG